MPSKDDAPWLVIGTASDICSVRCGPTEWRAKKYRYFRRNLPIFAVCGPFWLFFQESPANPSFGGILKFSFYEERFSQILCYF